MRRVVVVSALGLAVAVGVVQPVRAAHQSSAVQPTAGASVELSHGQGPGLAAQSVAAPPPPVNLGDYRFCASNNAYGTPPTPVYPVSVYLAGFSDTRKLGGAVPVGYPAPAFAQSEGKAEGLQTNTPTYRGHLFLCSRITLQLDQGGQFQLPPVTATLLGFGFEPVTATAILYQIAPAGQRPAPLTTVVYSDEGPLAVSEGNAPLTAVAVARLGLRVTSVKVDGVPLDVGPSCRSTGPLFTPGNPVAPGELMLTGGDYPTDPVPTFGGALVGGTLTGEADIPPLTGCVTPSGENLDPLLTASLSGPGNYVRQVVGAVCFPTLRAQCNSADRPSSIPLWTVTHGGPYTSSAASSGPLTFNVNAPNSSGTLIITCARSQIAGVFPDVTGPSRGGLATVSWLPMAGCSGSDGSTWSITQQGKSFLGPHTFAAGVASGNVDDMVFGLTGHRTGVRGACHALMEGYENATYSNAGSVLSLTGLTAAVLVVQSTCPDLPLIFSGPLPGNIGSVYIAATYPLAPGGYRVTSP